MGWKIFIFIVLTFLLQNAASADEATDIVWSRNVGGNLEEIGYDMVQTSDGGYIVTGMKYIVNTYEDVYAVKFSASGEVEWERDYAGAKQDYAKSVRQTDDGGYIICGGTYTNTAGVTDFYIMKLDSAGNLKWDRKYGENQGEVCEAVIQTKDGGYMAAGDKWLNYYDRDVYLVKLDAEGDMEWDRLIGTGDEDGAYDIQQTPDKGYIIAGYTRSPADGSYDMYIVKTDSKGLTEWESEFGGSNDEQAYSIEQHSGGYVAAGYAKLHDKDSDIYLVGMNRDGNMMWENMIGGVDTQEDARSIRKTSDGGFVLAGKTNEYSFGEFDAYLVKLDKGGNEQWSQVFGGQHTDLGYAALQSKDGGYVIAGQTKSFGSAGDVYILKTDIKTGGQGDSIEDISVNIPEYGSPANGVIFTLMMLAVAGMIMRRKKPGN